MKKLIAIFLMMFAVLRMINGLLTKIGGGISLSNGFGFHDQLITGTSSGKIGISFKGIYKISEPFQISPSFCFFFPRVTSVQTAKQTVTSVMFDIDGHYILNPSARIEFFALSGIDILYASEIYSSGGIPSNKETDNALGLNLGVGTSLKISEKHLLSSRFSQFIVTAGALLNINLSKKNENPRIDTNYPYL